MSSLRSNPLKNN